VHGLPPADGQQVDKSTARDLSVLSRELANKPATFTYTGTAERAFRDSKFIMRTHNHLLKKIDGCDGFKTGYFEAAGFSIVATAKRNGVRIIALVLGSKDRKIRDAKAAELLAKGFALVPPKQGGEAIVSAPEKLSVTTKSITPAEPEEKKVATPENDAARISGGTLLSFCLGFAAGFVCCAVLASYRYRHRSGKHGLIS
jgi:D-alanyl-D-alanine carboxypeptidase (penicillin-binding protein 5/6)